MSIEIIMWKDISDLHGFVENFHDSKADEKNKTNLTKIRI